MSNLVIKFLLDNNIQINKEYINNNEPYNLRYVYNKSYEHHNYYIFKKYNIKPFQKFKDDDIYNQLEIINYLKKLFKEHIRKNKLNKLLNE